MFVVAAEPKFTHTVEALVPTDGGHDKQSFKATFRVLPSDREEEFDLNTVQGSNDFLRAIVVTMDELGDAAGKPLSYNDGLRDQLFRLPYVRTALVKTYFNAIQKATEGN